MIMQKWRLEGQTSKNIPYFEIYVKFRHEIMSVMVFNAYFVFLRNIVEMQNDSAGFRQNFPNLIPEMKSAQKITPYTYYSCIGDSSTYVNIRRCFFF